MDGVSMGAALGPVLANIIMTEMERVVVDRLITTDNPAAIQQFSFQHRVHRGSIRELCSPFPGFRTPSRWHIDIQKRYPHSAVCAP